MDDWLAIENATDIHRQRDRLEKLMQKYAIMTTDAFFPYILWKDYKAVTCVLSLIISQVNLSIPINIHNKDSRIIH